MFTPVDKNLLIAAMESAIYHACVNANVVSLHAIETGVSALRQRFDQNPDSVTDDDVFGMVDTIERAKIPTISQISALNNETNIADRVVSFLWKNILEKPTTFPPEAHTHADLIADWNTLANKPTTFPPEAHTHADLIADWNTLANKPATFPPSFHQHPRRWVSLPVYFHGALMAGMTRMVIIPPGIQSAVFQSLTYAFGNTGTESYTTFGIEAFVNYEWTSFLTNPAFSAMGISAGGSPVASSSIQHEIDMGRIALPKADWMGEELLRISIVNIAPGAADVVCMLNFNTIDWPFDDPEA